MHLRIVMLGDIVGMPGIHAVIQLMDKIRSRWEPHYVIANAENAHNGSGLTPALYGQLMEAGVDGVTMGDHVYKRLQITKVLKTRENIIRPANLSRQAIGRKWMKLSGSRNPSKKHLAADAPPDVYVMTVLGRIFTSMPVDDPFESAQCILGELPELKPIVVLEVHAEATSEKQALGRFFDGQVTAVLGTHTHVATADAKILPHGTAYISDLGMCGPHESIIGRCIDSVLQHMTTSMPTPFDVAQGDPRVNGVFLEVDSQTRRATKIERIEFEADPNKPPFVAESV